MQILRAATAKQTNRLIVRTRRSVCLYDLQLIKLIIILLSHHKEIHTVCHTVFLYDAIVILSLQKIFFFALYFIIFLFIVLQKRGSTEYNYYRLDGMIFS